MIRIAVVAAEPAPDSVVRDDVKPLLSLLDAAPRVNATRLKLTD